MPSIPEAIAAAVKHHHSGRLQTAETIFRRILAVEPDQEEALRLLGNSLQEQGRLDEAVACYRRLLDFKPDFAQAHNKLGAALSDRGEMEEAIASFRRALELDPEYFGAMGNLGTALRDSGRPEEAADCWRRAVELKPDSAEAHANLGNALKDLGKLDEAVASYRRALELRPEFAGALNNLGLALKESGKLDEAAASYRRALEFMPDYADAHNNLGVALQALGELEEAMECFRRAVELNPDYAEAQNNLGVANMARERTDEAIACYRRGLEASPDHAELHCSLAFALKEQGKLAEALACCRRALELKPESFEAHRAAGAVLTEQGKPEEALAAFRRAVELKPYCADAHAGLGHALAEGGNLQEAESSFRTALRHDPALVAAHFQLAGLLRGDLSDDDVAAQRRLLEEEGITDEQRLLLHFGTGQVLDARGDYAEAARHFERANSLQLDRWRKLGLEYDPKNHETAVTRTIAACTPEFFARLRGWGSDSELPVFVFGLPRSGTTLVEQVLASHSRVFGAGELDLARKTLAALQRNGADCLDGLRGMDAATARDLASRHLDRLRGYDRAALRIVDKMPDNYVLLGLLAVLFPQAKFIHCRRDLRDVAVSCWTTQFGKIRWSNDPNHIASRFLEYRRIMAHWREVLPAPMLHIDYEEMVSDLEGAARRLVAWCGLEWEPSCLNFHVTKRLVRTASLVQVRRPLYATSVGRWRHYEHALGGVFATLEATAHAAGSR